MAGVGRRAIVIGLLLGAAACGGDDDGATATSRDAPTTSAGTGSSPSTPAPAPSTAPGTAASTTSAAPATTGVVGTDHRCVVYLHGKGGTGEETHPDGDATAVVPTGNAEGWGGRQWIYFPDERLAEARDIVAEGIDGCDQVILDGFSNGAAFAAALYCSGEDFGGRLVRVVVDDPVPDHGVDGCSPAPGVEVTLYWTGALADTALPGWDCTEGDWTCAGGETIGIEAYAVALGTEIVESPFDDHQWYVDAPELDVWR